MASNGNTTGLGRREKRLLIAAVALVAIMQQFKLYGDSVEADGTGTEADGATTPAPDLNTPSETTADNSGNQGNTHKPSIIDVGFKPTPASDEHWHTRGAWPSLCTPITNSLGTKAKAAFGEQLSYEDGQLIGRMIEATTTVFREAGIPLVAATGTLLGRARHHESIPWDDDLDGIIPRDVLMKIEKVPEIVDGLAKWGYVVQFDNNHKDRARVFDPKRPLITPYTWSWPFMDLFGYTVDESRGEFTPKVHTMKTSAWKLAHFFPQRWALFENDVLIPIPRDPKQAFFFDKSAMTEAMGHSWSHRREKSKGGGGFKLPISDLEPHIPLVKTSTEVCRDHEDVTHAAVATVLNVAAEDVAGSVVADDVLVEELWECGLRRYISVTTSYKNVAGRAECGAFMRFWTLEPTKDKQPEPSPYSVGDCKPAVGEEEGLAELVVVSCSGATHDVGTPYQEIMYQADSTKRWSSEVE